jgi:GT2 family glycosyltransferase
MNSADLFVVVVTYNRPPLLQHCVAALQNQSVRPARILIVDNASTDGTAAWVEESLLPTYPDIELVSMPHTAGGAGGFAEGLRAAMDRGAEWAWMMDDDAAPHVDALHELLQIVDDPGNVYGSIAVSGEQTSWVTTLLDSPKHVVSEVAEIPIKARVQSLPFLGFLIHRSLVDRIGLPDAGYFIAADDIEYCIRAERAGAGIFVAGRSRIEHPKSDRYTAHVPGRDLICLRLAPWKRYYDTRNRLLIARKYHGWRLLTQTMPGSLVRLYAALRYEPRKLAQLWSFCAGMIDGLFGIKGRRHAWWGIKP